MMMRCRTVAELLSSDQLRKASATKRLQVKLHLWMCKYCSRFQRQLEQLRLAARKMVDSTDAEKAGDGANDLEARLLRKLSGRNQPRP